MITKMGEEMVKRAGLSGLGSSLINRIGKDRLLAAGALTGGAGLMGALGALDGAISAGRLNPAQKAWIREQYAIDDDSSMSRQAAAIGATGGALGALIGGAPGVTNILRKRRLSPKEIAAGVVPTILAGALGSRLARGVFSPENANAIGARRAAKTGGKEYPVPAIGEYPALPIL